MESSHPNQNIQVFLYATDGVRGPPGKKWDFLPEEPAWTKLAKDGMENFAGNLANDGTGHKEQHSDGSAPGSPGKHTFFPSASPGPLIAHVLSGSNCACTGES